MPLMRCSMQRRARPTAVLFSKASANPSSESIIAWGEVLFFQRSRAS